MGASQDPPGQPLLWLAAHRSPEERVEHCAGVGGDSGWNVGAAFPKLKLRASSRRDECIAIA
jgi:hypothetical protein